MRNRDRSSCATGHLPQGGLTKREAAAIAAMQGMMAGADEKGAATMLKIAEQFCISTTQAYARSAIEMADALFHELDEEGDDD